MAADAGGPFCCSPGVLGPAWLRSSLGLYKLMKTTRELSNQPIHGGDRILMVVGVFVLACSMYLIFALKYHFHTARPLAGVVGSLAAPICFLLSVRELARYRRTGWVIIAVASSGLAAALAWLAVFLIVSGRLP